MHPLLYNEGAMSQGSTTELIKEKLDIVTFLKGYVELQQAGKNFKARCPFHNEKTPSFMVSPERQSWHCFGCALGGDIFAFAMRYENIEFGEALKMLAERAGVELRRANPAEYQQSGILYDINRAAADFFRSEFARSDVAKKYLEERALKRETIDEFEIGWAPQTSESLNLYLLKKGYRPEEIVRAGLAFRNERGLQSDRFRGRIMFPIHNHFGKVVGFTGRVLPQFDDGNFGKYVNSPERPIFNKSKLLYGFWKTKNNIRDKQQVFLVEGQMDMLMSYQAGLRTAIATSGTALTTDHLRVLRRLSDELILSFDNDAAGLAAGERAIDLAEANDFNVRVAVFDGFKDPAEVAEKDPQKLLHLVDQAIPAPEFYFKKYLPQTAFDFRSREHLQKLRTVLTKLVSVQSPVLRSFWLTELAHRAGVEENAILEEFEKIKAGVVLPKEVASQEIVPTAPPSRRGLLSQHLLSAVRTQGDFTVLEECVQYFPREYEQAFQFLRLGKTKSEDPFLDQIVHAVMLETLVYDEKEIEELKTQIRQEYLKDRKKELTRAARDAERAGDEAKLHKILQELDALLIQQ
jgi:DNA primase